MDELEEEKLLNMFRKKLNKFNKNKFDENKFDENKFEEILKQTIQETFNSKFKLSIESNDNNTHILSLEGTKAEIKTALTFLINDLEEKNILSKKEILIAVIAGMEID